MGLLAGKLDSNKRVFNTNVKILICAICEIKRFLRNLKLTTRI